MAPAQAHEWKSVVSSWTRPPTAHLAGERGGHSEGTLLVEEEGAAWGVAVERMIAFWRSCPGGRGWRDEEFEPEREIGGLYLSGVAEERWKQRNVRSVDSLFITEEGDCGREGKKEAVTTTMKVRGRGTADPGSLARSRTPG